MNLSAELDRWLSPEVGGLLSRVGTAATGLGCAAYLVGGPVRDLLLGRSSLDLDVVVDGDATAVARAALAHGEQTLVVHPVFGTATIRSGGFRIDLASARAELYERPGALPVVRSGSIEQDLMRRDFSINAMALALDGHHRGELLDLHGGFADLQRGLLRVLHSNSFVDDATRILRGVRYEQRFGFVFEEHTLALLQRDLHFIGCISGDRVRHEFERTYEEDEPEQALQRLDALGVLAAVHPTLAFGREKAWALGSIRSEVLSGPQRESACWCVLAWAMSGDEVDSLDVRLNLPRRIKEPLADCVELAALERRLEDTALRPVQVYELLQGRSPGALTAAEHLMISPVARGHVSEFLHRLRHVRPSLTGKDLRAMGVPEGLELGRILAALRVAKLSGRVMSREDELALARVLCRDGR